MKLAAVCTLLVMCFTAHAASQTTLNVSMNSQGYQNFFVRQDNVSIVTMLTGNPGTTQRVLVATPAGNAGAVAYFNATNNSTKFDINMVNGSLHSLQQGGISGVAETLTFNQNATFTRAIVGSMRAMRDYVEGNGLTHEVFSHVASKVGSFVMLSHQYINGSNSVNLTFTPVDAETQLNMMPDGNFTVSLNPGTALGMVNFIWLGREEQLAGCSPSELLTPDSNLTNSTEAQQV